jgi:hypothetical protein
MDGALWMIGRIFDAVDSSRFDRLITFGKFLDALIRRIRNRREPLAIA